MSATFDTAEAASFLRAVFQDCYSGLISICWLDRTGRYLTTARTGGRTGRTGPPASGRMGSPTQTAGDLLPGNDAPARFHGKRGYANDAHMFPLLWGDLDFGTVGHKHEPKPGKPFLPLPPTEANTRKIITDLGEEPTYVVHSGGGLYPLWQFERPPVITADNLDEIKDAADQWQKETAKVWSVSAGTTGK